MKGILLVPSVRRTQGTGHLKRCLRLLRRFGGEARILLPRESCPRLRGWEEVGRLFAPDLSRNMVVFSPGDFDAGLVVFDRRETDVREFGEISLGRVSAGIDEGGPARGLFSFLIDTFPRLSRKLPANIADPGLVAEGPAGPKKSTPSRLRKVLLTFGGEDPAGLTGTTLRALLRSGLFDPRNIDIVEGPAFAVPAGEGAGKVFRGVENLRPLLADYDAVFTSFGLTPYEAEKEGCLAALVNPSRYHGRLSRRAGFTSLGVKGIRRKKLAEVVLRPDILLRRPEDSSGDAGDLHGILGGLSPSGPSSCPVCGSAENSAIHRKKDATFFRCRRCGIAYMQKFSPETAVYDTDYFFRDYKKQYGKTYLEDFGKIAEFSRGRLEILGGLLVGPGGKTLLDAGCAYGPFLAAARKAGFEARGLDVAEDAVRYVREELGIPADQGDFLSWEPGETFDAVTLWYVAEHFLPLRRGLEKAAALVRPGGVLALSTPNGRGVSGRFFPRKFYDESPGDHFTVWDTGSARKVLEMYGFRIKRIRMTGHHPERFPRPLRALLGGRGCLLASRLFGLGDTFEIYAERVRHG